MLRCKIKLRYGSIWFIKYIFILNHIGWRPPSYFIFHDSSVNSFTRRINVWQFTCRHITLSHDSTAQSSCLKYKHNILCLISSIWHLFCLDGRARTQREASLDLIGCPMMTGQKYLSHFWVRLSHHNFIHFLQSGFNEQNNQRDTRQTVTKRRQCLSDGPNVTDLRAAVCEGQAWHAAEQRGPRADPQSRLESWLGAPDTSPLCSDASLYMKRSPASSSAAAAATAAAAGLLSPLSSCLSPSKRMNLFISLHICVC